MPISIKRLSDGSLFTLPKELDERALVRDVKFKIRREFRPKQIRGCRLIFNGKIMNSKHYLHYYGVKDNDIIEMDDRTNWTSSSDSSST